MNESGVQDEIDGRVWWAEHRGINDFAQENHKDQAAVSKLSKTGNDGEQND